jgi:hypothetical protein
MKKFDYTTLTWSELLTKTKDWFNAPRAVTEALKRLKTLIDNIPSGGDSRPYKVYTALLTQSGTDAPVATVLENTLGNITWSYEGVGKYRANLAGAFTENKTFLLDNQDNTFYMLKNLASTNYIAYSAYAVLDDTLGDEFLNETPIEIRVYN